MIQDIENIKKQISDGEINPLIGLAKLKELSKFISDSITEVEAVAMKEADKYEKTFELSGYKFTKNEGRAIYDFKGVAKWNEIKNKLSEIEQLAKASANNYMKFKTSLVTEDGEVIEPCEIKYSKPSITVLKIN